MAKVEGSNPFIRFALTPGSRVRDARQNWPQAGGIVARYEGVEHDRDTPPVAWWAGQPVRLRVLLVCLCVAAVSLVGTRTDYDVVADVLVFSAARQAREFFSEAASTDCHRAGRQRPALWPPQARNLAWVNPDLVRQHDVFLLRGRRVYRVAAVRLADARALTPQAERRVGAEALDTLACTLSRAGCTARREC
jgi:hypothetical protein